MTSVKFEIQPSGVAKVVLHRPDKKNSFHGEMIARLRKIAETIRVNSEIRVVTLTGAGDFFCAGADLAWMKNQIKNTPAEKYREASALAKMLKAWFDIPVPVLAGVQGGAFGGGLGLVVLADEVIGVRDAKFSFSEVKLGLIPATISPYVQRSIGNKIGNKLLLSGRIFLVDEAREVGLVDDIVAPEELESAMAQKCLHYLECSPSAVKVTKKLFRGFGTPITDHAIEKTVATLVNVWADGEAEEGVKSFFLNTKPSWCSEKKKLN